MSESNLVNILITGGCGFIASNFIQHLLKIGKYRVYNVDKLDYCSNVKNVEVQYDVVTQEEKKVDLTNYTFIRGNIRDTNFMVHLLKTYDIQYIMHFAAQTSVDNSFGNVNDFVYDNVAGTTSLLEACREYGKVKKFIHVSTDEVYGTISPDTDVNKIFKHDIKNPTNPYAATKVGAECMVNSYAISYGIPTIITRSNNVYGPRQYYDKLIPRFCKLLSEGKKCTIHGTGEAKRNFLHVYDASRAYLMILEKGEIGKIYEMGVEEDYSVMEVTKDIIQNFKENEEGGEGNVNDWITFVEDRHFQDLRYCINTKNLNQLGWKPIVKFTQGLRQTIKWYQNYAIPNDYWSKNRG